MKINEYLTFVVDADNDYEPISSAEVFRTSDIKSYFDYEGKEFEENEDGDYLQIIGDSEYRIFMDMSKAKFHNNVPDYIDSITKDDMRELFGLYQVYSEPLGGWDGDL